MTTNAFMPGFGQLYATEAKAGALPQGQNNPQQCPHGLYAEQISGSAFTAPRKQNFHTWVYRTRPSVAHSSLFKPYKHAHFHNRFDGPANPSPMRWDPQPAARGKVDFIDGLMTFAGHGDPRHFTGAAIHLYHCNQSMAGRYFYDADGELLIVPQAGRLTIKTELGQLQIGPGEIGVVPRGIKLQVLLEEEQAAGYVLENFGAHLTLPELGPIGANGLANLQDFQTPVAACETLEGDFTLIAKYHGNLWSCPTAYSPFDVAAWRGNCAPYQYDLRLYNTMNTVSYDHPDPSIFTVLTSQTTQPGVANVDFVIFPARWMVAEHTFRPPYYHRNVMSEFMGLIYGDYDAKGEGFHPGGASLHNCMTAHGPDAEAFEKGSTAELKPERYQNTLAFMFESLYAWQVTDAAYKSKTRQTKYHECWAGLA